MITTQINGNSDVNMNMNMNMNMKLSENYQEPECGDWE